MLTRFESWKNGDYAGLWFEATFMKQAKKINLDSIETVAARAKFLYLQGQFGRAAKILSSDGVAPENKETLKELMNLNPAEEMPPRETDCYSSYAYQFDEASVFKHLQSFSNFTAAGPSKMYPEHFLHAVTCAVPDQSKKSITSITKLVNLASRGQLPSFAAPTFCSASLTALKKTKGRCIRKRSVQRLLNFFHPDDLAWQLIAVLKALYMQQNKPFKSYRTTRKRAYFKSTSKKLSIQI